jgi:hypothetical protein
LRRLTRAGDDSSQISDAWCKAAATDLPVGACVVYMVSDGSEPVGQI